MRVGREAIHGIQLDLLSFFRPTLTPALSLSGSGSQGNKARNYARCSRRMTWVWRLHALPRWSLPLVFSDACQGSLRLCVSWEGCIGLFNPSEQR